MNTHSIPGRSFGQITETDAFSMQDFGARDPTAGELGSNFSEKTLGNYDTDHIVK